jgi:hypothetical protein
MYLNNSETNRVKIRKLSHSDIRDWEYFFINNADLDYLRLSIPNQFH